MPKIFIAYSRRDYYRVKRLVRSLERLNPAIDIWFAGRSPQPDTNIIQSLNDAIHKADTFVLCASAASSKRGGAVLSIEKRTALERLQSDPNFRVINVAFRRDKYVPDVFRKFRIVTTSPRRSSRIWDHGIRALGKAILGE